MISWPIVVLILGVAVIYSFVFAKALDYLATRNRIKSPRQATNGKPNGDSSESPSRRGRD